MWTLALVEAMAAGYFLAFSRTYYRPVYLEHDDDHWLWRTEHHDWGGWHRPSSTAAHTDHCFTVTYRSNSYGARDRERSMTATAPRAVILGDSFVEGYAVAEERRLSTLLEDHLGFEILNFGMTHFGPLQYQIIYEQLARRFDHDVVIVGILPENDFTDNDLAANRASSSFDRHYRPYYSDDGGTMYPRPRPSAEETPFARYADVPEKRSPLRNVLRLSWLYGLSREIRTQVAILEHPRPDDYLGYFDPDPVRVSNVVGSLRTIKRLAAPRPVLVVLFPDYRAWSYVESHPGAYRRSVVATMRDSLESHGITLIDLLEAFVTRGLDKETLYLPCDGHWNEAGHQAAFESLLPVVADLFRRASRLRGHDEAPRRRRAPARDRHRTFGFDVPGSARVSPWPETNDRSSLRQLVIEGQEPKQLESIPRPARHIALDESGRLPHPERPRPLRGGEA